MDFAEPIAALIPGATGRVLEVMTQTSREMSVRAIARLAGVSAAQASRVLPALAELGIVERQDAPPAVLYRILQDHVAVKALSALARASLAFAEELAREIDGMSPPPASVAAFGSFARHEARADSDIDLLVVRPADLREEDESWRAVVDGIREHAQRLSGNRIEILEVGLREIRPLIRSKRPLWRDIVRDAVVIYGPPLHELR